MAKIKKQDSDKAPEQAPKIPVDEYHGMGGSYVIDPETGKRTRVAGPSEQGNLVTETEKANEIE